MFTIEIATSNGDLKLEVKSRKVALDVKAQAQKQNYDSRVIQIKEIS